MCIMYIILLESSQYFLMIFSRFLLNLYNLLIKHPNLFLILMFQFNNFVLESKQLQKQVLVLFFKSAVFLQ